MVRRHWKETGEIPHLQRLAPAPAGSMEMEMRPPLSIDRLIGELNALAQISAAEPPVVTRVVFSEADLRARTYVKGLCRDAGLEVREDAIGNTVARWSGTEPDLSP